MKQAFAGMPLTARISYNSDKLSRPKPGFDGVRLSQRSYRTVRSGKSAHCLSFFSRGEEKSSVVSDCGGYGTNRPAPGVLANDMNAVPEKSHAR